jgi:V-type H+-transporting ATPase subunit C
MPGRLPHWIDVPCTAQSGTLNTLLTLSESLPKTDSFFTTTVSKLLDTLRTLLGDDAAKLEAHTRVNDRPLEEYLFPSSGQSGWKWDRRRWSADGKVVEVVESLNKVGPAMEAGARDLRGRWAEWGAQPRGKDPTDQPASQPRRS